MDAQTAKPQRPAPTASRGKVSYYREVAPILRTACIGCHSMENAAGGLALTSYSGLMKGGRNGASVVAGKGAESRLVKMLIGTVQPKMPPGGGLKQPDIDRFKQWIDEGAKEDTPVAAPVGKGPKGRGANSGPKTVRQPVVSGANLPRYDAPTPVTALAFSPDSKTLAVGLYQQVQLWDVATRKVAKIWSGHRDAVRALAFTKDGKWLAAGGGSASLLGEVRLWDVAAGREARAFGDHTDLVNAVAFSPDGAKIATGSADKTIRLWETATGKSLGVWRDHSDTVLGLAYSPDGKYIASCSGDKSVKVWDANAGKRLYSIGAHDDVVTDVEFSPDGKQILSSSADRSAKLWNFGPESSGHNKTFGGHGNAVYAATFSSDGQMVATASGDKTVKLWAAGGGNNTATFTESKDWLYSVRFSPDRKLLAAGTWDGQVLLWTVADNKPLAALSTLKPEKQ